MKSSPALVSFAGFSNTGKTTLITSLIPVLKARGLTVCTLKHAGHGFDMDRPGKDTFKHREAGAEGVMVVGPDSLALIRDLSAPPDARELAALYFRGCDVVLVEGFKSQGLPKFEVLGRDPEARPRFLEDPELIAVVGDQDLGPLPVPRVSPEDSRALADLVVSRLED